ncbi:MAG: response regulator [Oculatellaceae cyanobacterium bins.114]|nr:response regulator [Oculatellaceae cyanobacterium bins.114]
MKTGNHSWAIEPGENVLVLVVDDDCGLRQLLRKKLEAEGYQVIEAVNGKQAIELCQRDRPELVLLDAVMPVMDGFTCCQQLSNADLGYTPLLLIITVLEDEASIHQAFQAGADDFVTKPINWVILKQRVRKLIQQARLMQQVRRYNDDLEQYAEKCNLMLRQQTAQLVKGLEFESALKRITDKVRSSLNEDQILQTAVQELAWTLEVECCNASVYNDKEKTAHVCYEYSVSIPGYLNRVLNLEDFPEIYQPLLANEPVQFCSTLIHEVRGRVALFAFPIFNGHAVGDLWLICESDRVLEDLEIRLVQQVANQCAIAIRQARLYQEAQNQLQTLEHLNRLKDDFLSTVSHELRTPLTSMRLSIQLLERLIRESNAFEGLHPALTRRLAKSETYVKILQIECEREIGLVNDLLDLQRLETNQVSLNLVAIDLTTWLPQVIKELDIQVQNRQQTLHINLTDPLPSLQSDPTYLKRILFELINNAHKHSPEGASITVAATVENTQLRLSITNTGVEIPLHERERIFDKFYRAMGNDPWKQGGTGLGLSLVKRLVKRLGGTVEVTGEMGQTCFIVELPLSAPSV